MVLPSVSGVRGVGEKGKCSCGASEKERSKLSLKKCKCKNSVRGNRSKVQVLQDITIKPVKVPSPPPKKIKIIHDVVIRPAKVLSPPLRCISGQPAPLLRNLLEQRNVYYADGKLHVAGNQVTQNVEVPPVEKPTVEQPASQLEFLKGLDDLSLPEGKPTFNISNWLGGCSTQAFNEVVTAQENVQASVSALAEQEMEKLLSACKESEKTFTKGDLEDYFTYLGITPFTSTQQRTDPTSVVAQDLSDDDSYIPPSGVVRVAEEPSQPAASCEATHSLSLNNASQLAFEQALLQATEEAELKLFSIGDLESLQQTLKVCEDTLNHYQSIMDSDLALLAAGKDVNVNNLRDCHSRHSEQLLLKIELLVQINKLKARCPVA